MTSWRDGAFGALQMEALHGAWRLGCWLLCAVMFPLGMMNMAALAALTVVVFAEKTLPWGAAAAKAMGALLLAYGLCVLIAPQALHMMAG